jgi:hypothetical protein
MEEKDLNPAVAFTYFCVALEDGQNDAEAIR